MKAPFRFRAPRCGTLGLLGLVVEPNGCETSKVPAILSGVRQRQLYLVDEGPGAGASPDAFDGSGKNLQLWARNGWERLRRVATYRTV